MRWIGCLITVTVAVMILVSCDWRAKKDTSALKLQVSPLPGVYVQHESLSGIFRVGNELIERRISVDTKGHLVSTVAFINKLSKRNYVRSVGMEFSFRANGVKLSGVSGDFEFMDHEIYGAGGVRGLVLELQAKREEIGLLEVKLIYEVYAHMPVIRKWIEVENSGGSSVTVDSVQVESLNLLPGSEYDLRVRPADADTLSPTVLDVRLGEGFFVGNEAPGVLKYSSLYSDGTSISIGMKPHSQSYATEIQLAPGERFTSPAAFILLFKGEPDRAKKILTDFIAEHITRSAVRRYSVWYENILTGASGPSLRERIQLAARSGARIFCLGGRWADKRGDWTTDEDVRIEELCQYAHDLGMKFGLSLELAIVDPDSQIAAEHPQWFAKSQDGSDCTIHDEGDGKMMCLGSEYAMYISREIDRLVSDLNLDYVKLTGPMLPDAESAGCFAKGHIHRSSAESLWYIYEGLFALCRYLHSRHPELIIQVSPNFYNPGGTVDYALLKYADMEW